jgi:CheY-like chemotaxis protein
VSTVLAAKGYRVLEAADGRDALAVGENHPGPLHLLLTDVMMPGLSGRELAERLTPLRPDIRVVFMSGYAEDDSVRRPMPGRISAFLAKPFRTSELARVVREVLDTPAASPGEVALPAQD